eukprot:gene9832-11485_t
MFKQIISIFAILSVASVTLAELDSIQSVFGFSLAGASIYGNIAKGGKNGSVEFDSNTFSFSGVNAAYAITYAQANVGTGGGNINASADFFASGYQPFLLVEYDEVNDKDGYQHGEDTILGWTRIDLLGNLIKQWDISKEEQKFNTTVNGKVYEFPVFIITATSPTGLVTFRFTVSGAPAKLGELELTSEQTKIDITINGYYNESTNPQTSLLVDKCEVDKDIPFSCTSTGANTNTTANANSRLAMASWYGTFSAESDLGVTRIISDTGKVQGVLKWVSTAEVANKSVNIHTNVTAFANIGEFGAAKSSDVKGKGGLLVQSFDSVRPDQIVWDPTFGVARSGTDSTSEDDPSEQEPNSATGLMIPTITLLLCVVLNLVF